MPLAIADVCRSVFIIAHKEDVSPLADTLTKAGFQVSVQRQAATPEQQSYSSSVRALMNHAEAWRKVAAGAKPSIIVEADFVPCRDFARLPVPFPSNAPGRMPVFGYLYAGSPILYGIYDDEKLSGHASAAVAYVLSPDVARMLLDFYELETAKHDPKQYSLWDSRLSIYLRRERGVHTHLPVYQCGEHGGVPNPEHRRAGLRATHRADILAGRLAFLPAYAAGTLQFRIERFKAWVYGWARLFALRYFDPRYVNEDTSRGRGYMVIVSALRLLRF